MNNARVFILFAILSMFSLSSCSKKGDDVTPDQQNQQQDQKGFRVKIDGKDYAPDFQYALTNVPGKDGHYGIYGLDSKTSDVVAIVLPNTAGEGTYTLKKENLGVLNFENETYSTIIEGSSGTVTIKKKTATEVSGTFSFTAYEGTGKKKRTLTEGSFQVSFR